MTREDFIKALNLQDVDQAKQDEIIQNALIVVEHRAADVIDGVLSDDQAKQLNDIVDSDDSEAVERWLKENVPNLAEIYQAVLQDYAEELQEELSE